MRGGGVLRLPVLTSWYRQLEQLESRLDQLTPQGARVADVRAGLSREGIQYWERVQESEGPLLSDGSGVKISANPGEYHIVPSSYRGLAVSVWRTAKHHSRLRRTKEADSAIYREISSVPLKPVAGNWRKSAP